MAVRSVVVFTVLALGLGWVFTVWQHAGGFPIAMWTPAMAAAITYVVVERRSLWSSEVRHIFGVWSAWPLAWSLCGLALISYAIMALLNPGLIYVPAEMHRHLRELPGSLGEQIVLLVIANLFVGAILNGIIAGLGEEIGWRGFLYPRLHSLLGIPGLFIGGVIWALWHAPMFYYLHINYPTLPWWLGTLYFMLFTIPTGIILFAIYRKTRSIVAVGIAHEGLNAVPLFASFFFATEKLNTVVYGSGLLTMAIVWIVAIVILKKGFAAAPEAAA